MVDRETPRMRKYGESKTTRIMMATLPHVTSGSGRRKFQAAGFLFDSEYLCMETTYTKPVRTTVFLRMNPRLRNL